MKNVEFWRQNSKTIKIPGKNLNSFVTSRGDKTVTVATKLIPATPQKRTFVTSVTVLSPAVVTKLLHFLPVIFAHFEFCHHCHRFFDFPPVRDQEPAHARR